jgi:hypothetical protein
MRLWAGVAVVLAVGCGGAEDAPHRPVRDAMNLREQRVCEQFTLSLEEAYLPCREGCYSRVQLTDDGVGYVALADEKGQPEAKFLFALTEEELGSLKASLAESFTQKWEDAYGCPGCTDGQWYTVGYLCNGWEWMSTVVGARQRPEFLEPLISRLRELRASHAP